MDFDEIRFRHIGLSTDGAVIFCEMDNGSTYAMPLDAWRGPRVGILARARRQCESFMTIMR